MTCSECSHWDEINCFCWVTMEDINSEDAQILSCAYDDSIEQSEEDYEEEYP